MRFALWSVVLAALAVAIALLAKDSGGYVVIVSAPYRIELSLNLLVFIVLGGYVAFYALARFLATLVAIPARVALLARDEAGFRDDLKASQAWIAKYYDVKAKPTVAALASLKQIADTPVAITVPDINASLAAVRTARAAREKR